VETVAPGRCDDDDMPCAQLNNQKVAAVAAISPFFFFFFPFLQFLRVEFASRDQEPSWTLLLLL
jgi:hypothetical protein